MAQQQQKPELLEETKSKLPQAQTISENPSFNLTSLCAMQKDEERCKDELMAHSTRHQ